MGYTVRDADGEEVAGDPELDSQLLARADQVQGFIVDDGSGDVIYKYSPAAAVPAEPTNKETAK